MGSSLRTQVISDRDDALEAVRRDWRNLQKASKKLRGDRQVVLEALEQARPSNVWDVLQAASADLMGDKEVILKALENACGGEEIYWVLQHMLEAAPADLQGDKEVWLKALEELAFDCVDNIGNFVLKIAPADLRGDKEVMLKAVAKNGRALEYASGELQGDKDLVLTALEQVRSFGVRDVLGFGVKDVLAFASADLRGDKEMMLKAVKLYAGALELASDDLRGDKDLVMEALEQGGDNWGGGSWLKIASADLRGDKEVVLKALEAGPRQSPIFVLETASADLLGDKEVMLKAVCRDGRAFQYAAPGLKGDKSLALEAVRHGCRIRDLPWKLRWDPDVRRASRACGSGLTGGSERITFIGAVAKRRHGRCYASFPGKHAKAWNGLTRMADVGKLSTACVFLTTKQDGLGCHSETCMCRSIYGRVPAERYIYVVEKGPKDTDKEYETKVADAKKDAEAMGQILLEKAAFGTEEAWEKAYGEALALAEKQANDCDFVAPWGCMWFAVWRTQVEEARKLDQELVVVYFKGKTGKGKLPWDDLADPAKLEKALEDNGLGFSQRAEIAWLEKCGYPVTEIDIAEFCAECGLEAPTE